MTHEVYEVGFDPRQEELKRNIGKYEAIALQMDRNGMSALAEEARATAEQFRNILDQLVNVVAEPVTIDDK